MSRAATIGPAASRPLLPLFGLVGLGVIWGFSVPLTKLGLRDFPPLLLAALRYAAAAPFFALLLVGRPLPSRRALLGMMGLGALGIGVGQVTQILGIQRTEASVATIITASIPIFVVLLAGWRLRQRLRAVHGLGLILALAGVAVVATGGAESSPGAAASALTGVVLMLVSAVCIALYYVLSAELTRHYPVSTVAAWSSLFGVAVLLPAIPWELGGMGPPRLLGIGIVLYLGVLVTVAGMWISAAHLAGAAGPHRGGDAVSAAHHRRRGFRRAARRSDRAVVRYRHRACVGWDRPQHGPTRRSRPGWRQEA